MKYPAAKLALCLVILVSHASLLQGCVSAVPRTEVEKRCVELIKERSRLLMKNGNLRKERQVLLQRFEGILAALRDHADKGDLGQLRRLLDSEGSWIKEQLDEGADPCR